MADCVLIADPNCRPDDLLALLDAMPGVVTAWSLPLSSMLFETARHSVREYRRAVGDGRMVSAGEQAEHGMMAGRAALDAILAEVRARTRCGHVVLHDTRALAFPLADAAGLKIIELVCNEVPDDSDARRSMRAALNRLRGPERFRNAVGYLRVDEERLRASPEALTVEIAAFLEAGERYGLN